MSIRQPAYRPGSQGNYPSSPLSTDLLPLLQLSLLTPLPPGVKKHGEGVWMFSSPGASAPRDAGAGEEENLVLESRRHRCSSSLYCCID